jgi:hypothetical protein
MGDSIVLRQKVFSLSLSHLDHYSRKFLAKMGKNVDDDDSNTKMNKA